MFQVVDLRGSTLNTKEEKKLKKVKTTKKTKKKKKKEKLKTKNLFHQPIQKRMYSNPSS